MFQVIQEHNPDFFIELGTCWGGLALMLNERFPDLEIHTFDKHQRRPANREWGSRNLCDNKVHFYIANLLSGDTYSLTGLLSANKRKILYCDNGDKAIEIKKFAPYLREGDLIGVHDWLTRPPIDKRTEKYRQKRLKNNGCLKNTAVVEDGVKEIENILSSLNFKKYNWEIFEKYPKYQWTNSEGVLTDIFLTDPRASSRFWIKEEFDHNKATI
jgi:hypothetical protein